MTGEREKWPLPGESSLNALSKVSESWNHIHPSHTASAGPIYTLMIDYICNNNKKRSAGNERDRGKSWREDNDEVK